MLYVPDLGINLVLVSTLMKQDALVEYLANFVVVQDLSFGYILASGQ